jgi:WD40 repeat protein
VGLSVGISHSQDGKIVGFVDRQNNQLNINTYTPKDNLYVNKTYSTTDVFCHSNDTFCKNIIANNGKFIITANKSSAPAENILKLWQIDSQTNNWKNVATKSIDKNITALAISPDDRKLAVSLDGGGILLYTISDNMLSDPKPLPHSRDYIEIIKFMSDNQNIIIGTNEGKIEIFDPIDLKVTVLNRSQNKQKNPSISALDLSPDGSKLAAGDKSGEIALWDIQRKQLLDINQDTKKETTEINQDRKKITEISFSPDSQSIASSNDKEIKIWKINNSKLTLSQTLIGNNDLIDSINFSPNGKNIISGSRDGLIISWKLLNSFNNHSSIPDNYRNFVYEDCQKLLPSSFPDRSITQSCSTSPVGDMIATSIRKISTDSKSEVIFRSQSGEELPNINRHWDTISGISSISFSHDGKVLLTGNENAQLQLCNLEGKLLKTIDTSNQKNEIITVKFGFKDREIIGIYPRNENKSNEKIYYDLRLENLQRKANVWIEGVK